ncbi:NUDIX hydrolase [Agrobacterium tumefaciens]|uniref:NUDIX hydrolase n=1 Tax=Agrobacterium tumefaciens TaxID=358 RepID=A0A176XGJ9_AGRTU|nr:NUDIX domain-containing protein [Agrobacterium tumefaciens]OAE48910.1 NUDIX hydrolase [Agrobacterium tumefaciens]
MTRTMFRKYIASPDDKGEVQRVGVLPSRIGGDGQRKVLLVTAPGREQWVVPNGSIEEENLLAAASRHAFKVAGIIGDISPDPVISYRYIKAYSDESQLVSCVTIFAMNVRGTLTHWREKAHRKRRWFSLQSAADRLGDIALADFVRKLETDPGCFGARRRSDNLILRLSERRGSGV